MNETDRTQVILRLQDKGCQYIQCYYSGGGDDGSIEELYYFGNTYKEIYDNMDEPLDAYSHKEHPGIDTTNEEDTVVNDLLYAKLNNIEDWWNNDGGYGYMALRLSDLNFRIDNNCYYTQTQHYAHQGSLEL